jgi:hypothetical protein
MTTNEQEEGEIPLTVGTALVAFLLADVWMLLLSLHYMSN